MACHHREFGTYVRVFYPASLLSLRKWMNAEYRIDLCKAELENLQKDQQRIRSVCIQPDGQQHDVYTDHVNLLGQELARLNDRVNELETLRDQKIEEVGKLFHSLLTSKLICVEKVSDMNAIVKGLQPAGFNGQIWIVDFETIAEREKREIRKLCAASNIIVQN